MMRWGYLFFYVVLLAGCAKVHHDPVARVLIVPPCIDQKPPQDPSSLEKNSQKKPEGT